MGNPVAVILSSVGVSRAVNVSWMDNSPLTAHVALGSSTMSVDFVLNFTLDDLQSTVNPFWFGWSSAPGSSAVHFSSANYDAGVLIPFLNPIAGLRISSTALSSSNLTLRVLEAGG
jgi:hypothetical protein